VISDTDNETMTRFYTPRTLEHTRPNSYIMRYWVNSISFRYYIEIMVFITVAITFQWFINRFGDALMRFRKESFDLINEVCFCSESMDDAK